MDRRRFIKVYGAATAGMAISSCAPRIKDWSVREQELFGEKKTGHFSLTQISSATDNIGESYLMKTTGGKVIMIDGGFASDLPNLRGHLAKAGNHVDIWFITHPHQDHMEALVTILDDMQGITIDKVLYSRLTDEYLDCEKLGGENARGYYKTFDNHIGKTDFLDIHRGGQRFDIDGVGIMVLGVSNMAIKHRSLNNQSMVVRMWDDTKSVVFLGDAEAECGENLLAEYKEYLDCDYLQMAHHGQNGVSEEFYKSINFRACLWPTPSWVWEPTPDKSWLKTRDTRRWMVEKGITEHHVSCVEKDWMLL